MAKCKQTFPSAREVIDNVVCNECKRERERERDGKEEERGKGSCRQGDDLISMDQTML